MKKSHFFEIPSLTSGGLQDILVDLAPLYRVSYLVEMKLCTAYNSPSPGVTKTPQNCVE